MAVGERVHTCVDAAQHDGAVVDRRGDLEGVDLPGLAVQQDAGQVRRVPGQPQGAGEVVAAAGGDEPERRAGAAEGAADAARHAVAADGEHDPSPLRGLAGQFPRVVQAAAVLGVQFGALLAEVPGQGEQGGRSGGRARGGVDDGGELAHRGASGAGRRTGNGRMESGAAVSRRAAARRG